MSNPQHEQLAGGLAIGATISAVGAGYLYMTAPVFASLPDEISVATSPAPIVLVLAAVAGYAVAVALWINSRHADSAARAAKATATAFGNATVAAAGTAARAAATARSEWQNARADHSPQPPTADYDAYAPPVMDYAPQTAPPVTPEPLDVEVEADTDANYSSNPWGDFDAKMRTQA